MTTIVLVCGRKLKCSQGSSLLSEADTMPSDHIVQRAERATTEQTDRSSSTTIERLRHGLTAGNVGLVASFATCFAILASPFPQLVSSQSVPVSVSPARQFVSTQMSSEARRFGATRSTTDLFVTDELSTSASQAWPHRLRPWTSLKVFHDQTRTMKRCRLCKRA
jgi:hypothetical protein